MQPFDSSKVHGTDVLPVEEEAGGSADAAALDPIAKLAAQLQGLGVNLDAPSNETNQPSRTEATGVEAADGAGGEEEDDETGEVFLFQPRRRGVAS